MTAVRPTIGDVLAHTQPGNVAELRVPAGFSDAHPDNPLALSILGHAVAARRLVGATDDFPLTDEFMRAVAERLGHRVGLKRCADMRRRLSEASIIQAAGSYARRGMLGGHRVRLWRLLRSPGSLPASTRKRLRVKHRPRRLAWFETVLGSLDGRPPPGVRASARRRMTTLDDLRAPGSAAA